VLLHPSVYGLVNDDPVAAMVADLVVSHTGMDRFKDLLFTVLTNVAGIDFRTHTRHGAKQSTLGGIEASTEAPESAASPR
jgi:hypothetical protein